MMETAMQSPRSVRMLPPNTPAALSKLDDKSLEDSYVAYILYCNPTLPSNLSTTELRRAFRSVPRTDGKSFETLTVFRLIHQYEKGEIPSWIALVTALGVEPPDLAKGGSGQKLQQYGVRLKRWAHAHHIDAFFQYLSGNSHVYHTQIPTGQDALVASRDGVPYDEDLALRALVPEFRPKRGRKKNNDDDNESIDTPNKRLRAGTPSTVDGRNSPRPDLWGRVSQSPAPQYMSNPNSQIAQMVQNHRTQQTPVYGHDEHLQELFSAASRAFGGDGIDVAPPPPPPVAPIPPPQQAQLQDMNNWIATRARDEYPQSAIDLHPPSNAFDSPDLNNGSRSAHPLAGRSSKAKKRGTSAISAAWNEMPSNTNDTGSRPRGRPPRKQNGTDTQYGSWSIKESIEEDRAEPPFLANHTRQIPAGVAQMQQDSISIPAESISHRPPTKKLSLTVPRQPAGNVRLATPPTAAREQRENSIVSALPRVTLNDDGSLSRPRSALSRTHERESTRERERQRDRLFAEERNQRRSSADFFNNIDEEASQNNDYDGYERDGLDDDMSITGNINWKQRAQILARKLKQAQDELRRVKKGILEVVMSSSL